MVVNKWLYRHLRLRKRQSMGSAISIYSDSSMQWNNDHGAWQWSSQMYFPGLANYEGRPFDISMTYSNF